MSLHKNSDLVVFSIVTKRFFRKAEMDLVNFHNRNCRRERKHESRNEKDSRTALNYSIQYEYMYFLNVRMAMNVDVTQRPSY